MLESSNKVVGVKQSRRAIQDGSAARVYLAENADPAITEPIARLCSECGIPVETAESMKELGRRCGIAVGASVVTVLR